MSVSDNIAVIYDLDETILPTRTIPHTTFEPVFNAIRNANKDTLSDLALTAAFDELWRKPIDVVAIDYGFSEAMINAGRHALINTDYKLILSPFDDFHVIREIKGKRILVTTGITRLQQAKIDALFNDSDFDEIIIDDPYQDNRLGKKNIFSKIAVRYQLHASQIWVIGDNPASEIAAGNELGMKTVQILRPGITGTDNANYVITSFHELKDLIDQ